MSKAFGIPDTYHEHGSSKLAGFEKSCGQEPKEGLGVIPGFVSGSPMSQELFLLFLTAAVNKLPKI